jgi:hypothetical protein
VHRRDNAAPLAWIRGRTQAPWLVNKQLGGRNLALIRRFVKLKQLPVGTPGEEDSLNITLLVILIVLNVPLYFLLGRSFFGGWEGLLQSVWAILEPPIVSAMSGNYWEHRIGRFTLLLYLIVCIASTAAEYHVVARFLLGMDNPWG